MVKNNEIKIIDVEGNEHDENYLVVEFEMNGAEYGLQFYVDEDTVELDVPTFNAESYIFQYVNAETNDGECYKETNFSRNEQVQIINEVARKMAKQLPDEFVERRFQFLNLNAESLV